MIETRKLTREELYVMFPHIERMIRPNGRYEEGRDSSDLEIRTFRPESNDWEETKILRRAELIKGQGSGFPNPSSITQSELRDTDSQTVKIQFADSKGKVLKELKEAYCTTFHESTGLAPGRGNGEITDEELRKMSPRPAYLIQIIEDEHQHYGDRFSSRSEFYDIKVFELGVE